MAPPQAVTDTLNRPFHGAREDSGVLAPPRRRRATTVTAAPLGALAAVGSTVALIYAVVVLSASWMNADLGFVQIEGVHVGYVEPGGVAAQAGMLEGDVIVAVNGVRITEDYARARAIWDVRVGDQVTLDLERAGTIVQATFVAPRSFPFASLAAVVLACFLVVLAFFANRGSVKAGHARTFFWATLVYVVLMAGGFSLDALISSPFLHIPWLFAAVVAGPVTCHHMFKFPGGPSKLSPGAVRWLYAPPLALAALQATNVAMFHLGRPFERHHDITISTGIAMGGAAALYLLVGAVVRSRRLRAIRGTVDAMAARWLHVGAFLMAAPLCVGVVFAFARPIQFITGGYKPLIAIAIVGGSTSVVLAMTRVPFGTLDAMWRRSSGYLLATGMAAALYLVVIGVLGGTASVVSGGDFRMALGATLAAAIMFGPVRLRVQQLVDQRFRRDRADARRMLREAAEAAAATLDINTLQDGVVHRVRSALDVTAASIYVADEDGKGWRRAAEAGDGELAEELPRRHPASRQFYAALGARSGRELEHGSFAVPIVVSDRAPATLVVQPREGRLLGEEERDLLTTICANLVVAFGNARAHSELCALNQRLQREVELAEARRLEIVRLKERVEGENRVLIGQLAARTGHAPVIGEGLVGTFELVHKVARTSSSVLVRGETGVGKELVARAIHAGSSRREGPFVVIDCGAISPGLLESTLFGHVRGAFTGAVKDALGAFRSAQGGTIFLDEIGELPTEMQPKLLRVLQERDVQPVGGEGREPIDVRVIAGTNRNLADEVENGNFRQDLLYRLQVVEIVVPPLRERRSDIEALATHFLTAAAERSGREPKRLRPDALAAILEYDWPGNVRELEHTLEAASVYAEGELITAADLPIFDQLFQQRGRRVITARANRGGEGGCAPRAGLREALEDLEQQRLVDALEEHDGNKTRAARALGMSRGALLRRLKRYGMM